MQIAKGKLENYNTEYKHTLTLYFDNEIPFITKNIQKYVGKDVVIEIREVK